MAKFVFSYHGGGVPETEEEQAQAMAAWQTWMGNHAQSFSDMGAPIGKSMTVSSSGSSEGGGANPITGYSIVEAADMAAACEIADGCPAVANGGSVEVGEYVELQM